uniref:Uncharacterized protein n=1 Tax=Anguilla anguilla TaxID=7936 RepID=A0A0E9XH06_ANGAN
MNIQGRTVSKVTRRDKNKILLVVTTERTAMSVGAYRQHPDIPLPPFFFFFL